MERLNTSPPIRSSARRAAAAFAALAIATATLWPAAAGAIEGNWSGELVGQDGDRVPISYQFSPRGALIVQLPAQQGYRAIELTHAGQADRWMTPGGHVASGRVVALDAGPMHFDARIRISSGGEAMTGVLRDEKVDLWMRFFQAGNQLTAYVQTRTEVTLSGSGWVPRPEVSLTVYQGQLQRTP